MAFGLWFGTDDRAKPELTDPVIRLSQKLMAKFEGKVDYMYCADIIENIILGYAINPGESDEAI